ncbi:glycosyl transferase [Pavlovales sp. CCMP2436]|nr:glycosyl transferase [Pavlovales sp. CCMP2436]
MKVAFLFLTRGGLHAEELWADFFRGVDPAQFSLYAHTKAPPPPSSVLARWRIGEIVPTEWGSISLVHATLALLRAAMVDEANSKFVLLSESCVPLYPFARVHAELMKDERAWLMHSVTPPWMVHQKGPTREFLRWSKRLEPVVPAPASLLKQQQWMAVTRPLAQLFLQPGADYTALWDGGLFAPDEHYFVNVVAHELRRAGGVPVGAGAAEVLDRVALNRRLTHVEWGQVGNGRAPLKLAAVTDELAGRARAEGCLFLRKVAPGADLAQLRAGWARI